VNRSVSDLQNYESDVVVVGGGGTGLAAAVAAAEKKARVILLEKRADLGGNAASTFGLFASDSHVQRRMAISAPSDQLFRTAMDYHHWRVDPRIWRAFVNKSASTIQWLEDKGIKFNEIPPLYPGQDPRTWHCPDAFKELGPEYVKALRKKCEELGVKIFVSSPAKQILTGENGKIIGVIAAVDGAEVKITTKSVIIGTGGYGGNSDLLKKYCPSYSENILCWGIPHNGDGLMMAIEAGAATEGTGVFILHPHLYPGSPHISAIAQEPSTIWVNRNGERFADETINFHLTECGNAVDRQPEKCLYSLFDSNIIRQIREDGVLKCGIPEAGIFAGARLVDIEKELQAEVDKGGVKISNTWDEIAGWMKISPESLKTTVAEYNHFCERGYDEIFDKDRRYLKSLHNPPYYAVRCHLSFLDTVGGIKINHRMEVLDTKYDAIPGLYAGGNSAGGWQSDTYCIILAGSTLGFAVNSGRIAGENAAKYVTGEGHG
jgi:fumarate reductase flavoprotein subunit